MDAVTITLAFLVFAIVMFAGEKIPLSITAMIVAVGLTLTGVLTPMEAFKGFVDQNVLLFFGMFIIGAAFFETGMAVAVGRVVSNFAKSETQLLIAVMLLTGFMSAFLSNTGTAAVMIPVVIGIAKETNTSPQRLLMTIVFASAMGGNISLIGSPGNMIGQSALIAKGLEPFSFFEYGYIGIPMLLIGTLFCAFIGKRFLPTDAAHRPEITYTRNYHYDRVPTWKKVTSGLVLLGTVLAMVFDKQLGAIFGLSGGLPLFVSSWIGALIIVATGVLSEKQAMESIDLKTILLFVGSLALGDAMVKSGAGSVIADTIMGLVGVSAPPFLIIGILLILCVSMTNFMSNTATCALLIPIGIQLAHTMNFDPHGVTAAIVLGSSLAYGTPVGMPANTMVYNAAGYSFREFVKAGTPLILVSVIVTMVLLPIFFPF